MDRLGTRVKLRMVVVCVWLSSASVSVAQAQMIPKEIWGKWVVTRIIPTETISCWGEAQAETLLHTEIDYSSKLFRWKNVVTQHPVVTAKVVTADQFHDDNSGGASDSSQVTFRQLGIKTDKAAEITIHHPPADVTGATAEIPGDDILVKNKNIIIFSACNIYFEAKRVPSTTNLRREARPH